MRLHARGLPAGAAVPFAAGALAAFVSTLGSTRLIRALERDSSLLPYALYRIALAGLIVRRLARDRAHDRAHDRDRDRDRDRD